METRIVELTGGGPVVEVSVEAGDWPSEPDLRALAGRAVAAAAATLPRQARVEGGSEVSVVFTDDAGIRRLNAAYRGKDKPTNVLSFPQPSGPLLGDIMLAAETVVGEAALAGRPLEAHMAHLIVHGFLHLLGYDHEDEAEAEAMEALERAALAKIGISDPTAAAREL